MPAALRLALLALLSARIRSSSSQHCCIGWLLKPPAFLSTSDPLPPMFFDGSSSSRKEVNLGGKRKGLSANSKDKASFVEQVIISQPLAPPFLFQLLLYHSAPSTCHPITRLQVSSLRAEREAQRRSEIRFSTHLPAAFSIFLCPIFSHLQNLSARRSLQPHGAHMPVAVRCA
jgi:hypothetical protein